MPGYGEFLAGDGTIINVVPFPMLQEFNLVLAEQFQQLA